MCQVPDCCTYKKIPYLLIHYTLIIFKFVPECGTYLRSNTNVGWNSFISVKGLLATMLIVAIVHMNNFIPKTWKYCKCYSPRESPIWDPSAIQRRYDCMQSYSLELIVFFLSLVLIIKLIYS